MIDLCGAQCRFITLFVITVCLAVGSLKTVLTSNSLFNEGGPSRVEIIPYLTGYLVLTMLPHYCINTKKYNIYSDGVFRHDREIHHVHFFLTQFCI